jgi:hypothetical protein
VSPLTLRGRQVRTRIYDPALVGQLAVALLAVGALWFATGLLAAPDRTHVTVVNPTDYDIDIAVHAPESSSVAVFGRVERGSSRTQPHLIDPGDDWVLTFRRGAADLGELRLSRDELDDLDHRVEIPPEVTRTAQDLGLTASPE